MSEFFVESIVNQHKVCTFECLKNSSVHMRGQSARSGIEGTVNIYNMKKGNCALSYSEKERICEEAFIKNGPYWHIYTDGTKMQNIFCSKEDFDTGAWLLAAACCLCPEVRLITFELMGNHVHLIVSGRKEDCLTLFDIFAGKLKRTLRRKGRAIDWRPFQASILPIESLQALRNEIIYTNRNAFVASPEYTPDSYPWGGGCAFFNMWKKHIRPTKLTSLKVKTQRSLVHSRDVKPFGLLQIIDNQAYIPSFCDIALGESVFRDPRSYFSALTRNAEAYSQVATRLKDSVFLTDDEIYSATIIHINKEYDIKQPTALTPTQKLETARHLHFKYNASNQQIRRILKLSPEILDELFPQ